MLKGSVESLDVLEMDSFQANDYRPQLGKRPSSRPSKSTLGSHSSKAFARVMLGRRCFGSSPGKGKNTILPGRPMRHPKWDIPDSGNNKHCSHIWQPHVAARSINVIPAASKADPTQFSGL